MSSAIPTIPVGAVSPAQVFPKLPPESLSAAKPTHESVSVAKPLEHLHAAVGPAETALTPEALSSTDVSYVKSLMGALPAQKMQEILLRTGIPMPANLGPNLDTSA